MIEVSKEIAHKLNKEYGVPFKDGGISTSASKNRKKSKKFYLCENKRNIQSYNDLLAK